MKIKPPKLSKFFTYNPFVTIWRQLYFRIKKRKISVHHSSIDAPIGILGLPNKISWEVENVVYVQILAGNQQFRTHKNSFQFINHPKNKTIAIHFQGINECIKKSYHLDFINVHKKPEPKPLLNYQESHQIEHHYFLQHTQPKLHTSFAVTDASLKLLAPRMQIEKSRINIHPLNLSALQMDMNTINLEQNISILTNKLTDENRFLPESQTRPYHETIMESRWF